MSSVAGPQSWYSPASRSRANLGGGQMPPAVALAVRVGLVMGLGGAAIWMLKPPDSVGRSELASAPAASAAAPAPGPPSPAPQTARTPSSQPSQWAGLPPAPATAPAPVAAPGVAASEPARAQGAPAIASPPPVAASAKADQPKLEAPKVDAPLAAGAQSIAPTAPVTAMAAPLTERPPPLAAAPPEARPAPETAKPAEAKVETRREDATPRADAPVLAFAPQPAAAPPDAQGKASPLLDDNAVQPPLPPMPARSIRRASAERPVADRSGGRKCELFVPRGYRVGWRIRGGRPTSCYVERIR